MVTNSCSPSRRGSASRLSDHPQPAWVLGPCLSRRPARGTRVHRATLSDGRQVAVKMADADRPAVHELLAREVATLERLHGILGVVQLRPTSEQWPNALVIEYVDGPNLGDWLDQRPSPEHLAAYFLRLGGTMMDVHTRLVVHRDLSPSNLGVNHDGGPVLFDWEFAASVDEPDAPACAGTPGFAAPELRGNPAESRTALDVFAYGRLLAEALAYFPRATRRGLLPLIAGLTDALAERRRPLDRATIAELKAVLCGERRSREVQTRG